MARTRIRGHYVVLFSHRRRASHPRELVGREATAVRVGPAGAVEEMQPVLEQPLRTVAAVPLAEQGVVTARAVMAPDVAQHRPQPQRRLSHRRISG